MPATQMAPPLQELLRRRVTRFVDREADWAAFADARMEPYRRAQHRYIGAGGSGKHDDANVIPAEHFTLSVMFVPVGQGNAAHTHEVEEGGVGCEPAYMQVMVGKARPDLLGYADKDLQARRDERLKAPR